MGNEKRLIYANAVQDKIDHEMDVCNSGLIRGELKFLKGCVNTIPTVDAIILPCKVGDTVYGQFHWHGKEIYECKVTRIKACQFKDGSLHYFLDVEFDIIDHYYNDGRMMRCQNQAVFGEDYGSWNRVYLTKKEAELAKKAGDGK